MMNLRRVDIIASITRLQDAAHEALQKRSRLRVYHAAETDAYKAKRIELQIGEIDKNLDDIDSEIKELEEKLKS